jgi:hypothetical protein
MKHTLIIMLFDVIDDSIFSTKFSKIRQVQLEIKLNDMVWKEARVSPRWCIQGFWSRLAHPRMTLALSTVYQGVSRWIKKIPDLLLIHFQRRDKNSSLLLNEKLKRKQIGAPPTGSVWCGSNFNSGKNFNREVRGAITKTQRGEIVFLV